MTPFYREVPALDPELAMLSADYWIEHAAEDLEATEQRLEIEGCAQIKAGDVQ